MRGSQISMSKVISFVVACIYFTILLMNRHKHVFSLHLYLPFIFGLVIIWTKGKFEGVRKTYPYTGYVSKYLEHWPGFVGWVFLIVPFVLTLLMLLEVI